MLQAPDNHQKVGSFYQDLFRQATQNLPLTVFGDGSAIRAFTHVEDMAEGIIYTMKFGVNGEAYNIGNPDNKTSIGELAKLVRSLLNSSSEIKFIDGKETRPTYEEANDKFPDSQKASKDLGWNAKHDIDKVIHDATNDYLKDLKMGS